VSTHFVIVGKDRYSPAPVPYELAADCLGGGLIQPYTLVLLINGASAALAQEETEPASDDATPAATVAFQYLETSVESVDVWLLRCTSTIYGQVVRAQVRDLGGVDNRRFYVYLTKTLTRETLKRTAPDGGTSSSAILGGNPVRSINFVVVGKDRAGVEAYQLYAECRTQYGIYPHTLTLLQNQ
jgi:hypothetical protein